MKTDAEILASIDALPRYTGTGREAAQGGANGAANSDQKVTTPLDIEWADDIKPSLDANDFVEGVLGRGQLSVVYGESGCGKTFWCLDLAFHVALGWDYCGRAVDKCAVVYCAAEGAWGARNRINTFRAYHDVREPVQLAAIFQSINLLNPDADTGRLIETVKAIPTIRPVERPGLVVVDTLSRALAGGNENSPDDMGALVMNADRIRAETGAHLAFIHHSGKDSARGARGHSLLRAATDTEIEVTASGDLRFAKVMKQRDMPTEGEFGFRLQSVNLGLNRRGKPVSSCVVVPDTSGAKPLDRKLSPNQQSVLALLKDAGAAGLSNADWFSQAQALGIGAKRKATFYDIRRHLEQCALVHEAGDRWLLR
jgi:RecA/RadA recombinase